MGNAGEPADQPKDGARLERMPIPERKTVAYEDLKEKERGGIAAYLEEKIPPAISASSSKVRDSVKSTWGLKSTIGKFAASPDPQERSGERNKGKIPAEEETEYFGRSGRPCKIAAHISD